VKREGWAVRPEAPGVRGPRYAERARPRLAPSASRAPHTNSLTLSPPASRSRPFGLPAIFRKTLITRRCRHLRALQARALAKMANAPRREGFACPVCKTAPPLGAIWRCGKCRQPFDTFESQGLCPHLPGWEVPNSGASRPGCADSEPGTGLFFP